MRKFFLLTFLLPVIFSGLSACSARTGEPLHAMPLDQMPPNVQEAPLRVQEAYQFTAANREVSESVPCYCGCVNIGHTSSYDCYVAETISPDLLMFDKHALNCGVCVDITQDVMRLMREGKSTPEIVDFINDSYSKLGAPTVH